MSNGTEWEEWAEGLIAKVDANLSSLGITQQAHADILDMVKKAVEDRREYWAEYAEMAYFAEQEK